MRNSLFWGFTVLFVCIVLLGGSSVAVPPEAKPRETEFLDVSDFSPRFLEDRRQWLDRIRQFLVEIYALDEGDRYVYGVANTLQLMVNFYVLYENRLPTKEEFLQSPYNLLAAEAWINPYTGEHIDWSETPKRGHLFWYHRWAICIIPWIPAPSVRAQQHCAPASRDLEGFLGIWGVYPGTGIHWADPQTVAFFEGGCKKQYYTLWTPCHIRRWHSTRHKYSEADWKGYLVAHMLSHIFTQIHRNFEMGMPSSLDEARQNYWWFYNTMLVNPVRGGLVQEVPFFSKSPGDPTYAVKVWAKERIASFLPRGEDGRFLYPYDHSTEPGKPNPDNLMRNLYGEADYVRGLEGRAYCEVVQVVVGQDIWEKSWKDRCRQSYPKVFLTSPPR